MDVKLVVIEGLRLGAVIAVRGERFLIGRDSRCQLRPRSPAVSTVHCAIHRRGDVVSVQDMGSTNGTLVNDRCLRRGESMRVKDGDRIQVAQLIFTLRLSRDRPDEGSDIVDWLNADERATPQDAMASTMILPVVAPRPLMGAPGAAAPLPVRSDDEAFGYVRYLEEARVVCAGIDPAQLERPEDLMAMRRAMLSWAADPGRRRIVVDASGVDLLPSSMFALLYHVARTAREAGGRLRLAGISREVRKSLATLRMDRLIDAYDTLDLAISDPWS